MKKLLILLFWGLSFVQQSLAVDSLVSMIWGDDLSSRARKLGADLPYDFSDSKEEKKNKFSLKTLDLSPARLAEHERRFEEARNLEERGDNDGALRLYLALARDWDLNSSRKLMDVCARGGLGLRKTERLIGLFLDRSAFLRQELDLRRDIEKFYEAHGYYDTPWLAAERGMPPPRVVPSEEDVGIFMAQPHKRLGWTEEEARAWLYSGLPAAESARLPTAAEASAASGGGSSEGAGSYCSKSDSTSDSSRSSDSAVSAGSSASETGTHSVELRVAQAPESRHPALPDVFARRLSTESDHISSLAATSSANPESSLSRGSYRGGVSRRPYASGAFPNRGTDHIVSSSRSGRSALGIRVSSDPTGGETRTLRAPLPRSASLLVVSSESSGVSPSPDGDSDPWQSWDLDEGASLLGSKDPSRNVLRKRR